MICSKERYLEVARSYIGYREKDHPYADLDNFKEDAGDGNYTKFSGLCGYGIQPWQWCQLFVCGVAVEACGSIADAERLLCDQDLGDGVLTSYTPTGSGYFKQAGRWVTDPEPGDIVYFYQKSMGRICHVGIVEDVDEDAKVIYTIEGNTNSDGFTTNGGCVARHEYSHAQTGGENRVNGFGRPRYEKDDGTTKVRVGKMTLRLDTVKRGDKGTSVLLLQEILKAREIKKGVPYYKGELDREFGPATERAVIDYQTLRIAMGAKIGGSDGKADGEVGEATWQDLLGLPKV